MVKDKHGNWVSTNVLDSNPIVMPGPEDLNKYTAEEIIMLLEDDLYAVWDLLHRFLEAEDDRIH